MSRRLRSLTGGRPAQREAARISPRLAAILARMVEAKLAASASLLPSDRGMVRPPRPLRPIQTADGDVADVRSPDR